MSGQLGVLRIISERAAIAPLRKVGPRLMVMLANQIMNVPNRTHWGESSSMGPETRYSSSSPPCSGKTGESLSTVVSMFTVDTVTKSRKAVSTRLHLRIGSQRRTLKPSGSRMAARPQSTIPWWKRRPCDQLPAGKSNEKKRRKIFE